jgi:D-alanyl-D-alanine carboxypeptidase
MTLFSAVLGTDSEDSRDDNTLSLLNWGFDNFHMQTLLHSGAVLARPTVKDQPGQHATVIAGAGYSSVLQNRTAVSVKTFVPRQLAGPLGWHAVVGYALVRAGGRTLKRVPLLLAKRLAAVSSLTLAARFITRPFTLFAVLVLLGLAAGLIVRRRGHSRTRGEVLSR